MSKLLDDAKAAGFHIYNEDVITADFSQIINNKLAKFAALQIPDGYKLVPIEPTEEMRKSAICEQSHRRRLSLSEYGDIPATETYKAMLAASPPTNAEE